MSTVAEAIRCPRCGTLQPPTLDFCDAPFEGATCLQYLAWSRPVPDPTPPEPLPEPALEAPSVQLLAAFTGIDPGPDGALTASVIPGDAVKLEVTLRNVGTIVDEFSVMVEGLPYEWVEPPIASLHLVPVGHPEGRPEGKLAYVIKPPRDSSATALSYPLKIAVRSVAHKRLLETAPATLIVRQFVAVVATARPPIAKGRAKARFWCDVRNDGNAAVAVSLQCKDSTDTCTCASPSGLTPIAPGQVVSLPVDVRARRKLIGQPVDHMLLIAVTINGGQPVPPPLPVTFRQLPLIPWWVPVALATLAALAIALYAVLPRKVTMPSVRGSSTVFVAQRELERAGLKSKPTVLTRVRSTVKSGTVIDQTPRAFKRVERDVQIVLRVAVPATYTIIPDLTGMTVGEAEDDLTRRYLRLGAVVPSGAPQSRKIASQIPLPGRARSRNVTAVSVVLEGPGKVPVPKVVCLTLGQAEKLLTAHGLKLATPTSPVTSTQQATGQVPAAKTKRPLGTAVTMLGFEDDPDSCKPKSSTSKKGSGSAMGSTTTPVITASGRAAAKTGEPVAFDDGDSVRLPSGGKPLSRGLQPAWSPDGKLLAVREGDRVRVSAAPGAPATDPAILSIAGWALSAPAFAPAGGSDGLIAVLAAREGAASRLCFARATTGSPEPSCLTLARLAARSIAWSPGGRAILVVGARPGQSRRPGVMRLRLTGDSPARAASWTVNRLLWRVRLDGRVGSVFDVAYDPASPRLAVVTNLAPGGVSAAPRVALMPIGAWPNLGGAQWLDGPACQVAWNPAGSRLAVVAPAASRGCPAEPVPGPLMSLGVLAPRQPRNLAEAARNPAWRP